MATINYNGMVLEEFTSNKPVAFPEGTKAICWDCDIYNEGFRPEVDIVAFIPYLKDPVLTRDYLNNYSPYRHCALLPDPPKPRRATNRELARWLAQGNGEYTNLKSDYYNNYSSFSYEECDKDNEIYANFKVRKWSDTEWHKPTVDYLFGGDK